MLAMVLAACTLLPAFPSSSAGVVVTTTADSGPSSLRQAIADAAPGDTITFAPGFVGVVALSSTLTLTKNVTIVGPGSSNFVLDGGNTGGTDGHRVLQVNAGVTATISGLAVRHGYAETGGGVQNFGMLTLTDVLVEYCISQYYGGGIANVSGILTMSGVVRGNQAGTSGGGIASITASGGLPPSLPSPGVQ